MPSKQSPIGPIKKGTLHKALGYKPDEKIPPSIINSIMNKEVGDTITANGKKRKITPELRKKANFAKNARKFEH